MGSSNGLYRCWTDKMRPFSSLGIPVSTSSQCLEDDQRTRCFSTSTFSTGASLRKDSDSSSQDVSAMPDNFILDDVVTLVATCICVREVKILQAVSSRVRAAAAPAGLCSSTHRVYLCGGAGEGGAVPLRHAESFDPTTGQWESVHDMHHPRRCATGATLRGKIYICGGSDDTRSFSCAECYDPELGSWKQLSSMTMKRVWASAGAVQGRLYVCGGSERQHVPHYTLSSVESYDPELCQWIACTPMLEVRRAASSAVMDGHLYICGGSVGSQAVCSVERYSPQNNRWELQAPMPSGRRNATCAVAGGKIYICGGVDGLGSSSSVVSFDANRNVWESLQPMLESRWWGASAIANGQLYVFGGTDGATALTSVEAYCLEQGKAGQWKTCPSLTHGRIAAVAAAVVERSHRLIL
eukprot:TRINITY_DN14917_c0_g1_i1.p1 TRINITY_DN14917_c0_g1~~TRINITY_DN14917_c0_g1_i1.p1  ORF type:complete len:419 (+),score=27.79 TRINITY_DN14917_c0_g1_i1:27-1259(+)